MRLLAQLSNAQQKIPPKGQNSVAFIYGTEQSSAGISSACKIVNLDTARVSAT